MDEMKWINSMKQGLTLRASDALLICSNSARILTSDVEYEFEKVSTLK